MRCSSGIILVLAIVCILVLLCSAAGCTGISRASWGPANTGSSASSGSAAAAAAPAATRGTCPAVTAATSWSGSWVSYSDADVCLDMRKHFDPATADNPDPWNAGDADQENFPVTFTQTGCDVTGSITSGPNSNGMVPAGCPITLTGKVDSTGAVSGTWKAYCNIVFHGTDKTLDSGVFSLNMEPGGSTFIGRFSTLNPDETKYESIECPSANSNWVGKRA